MVVSAPDSSSGANAAAIGRFLRARRARVRPESVGLVVGARRQVAGLRRSEVADAAGISSEYYVRIEQGRAGHPSDGVLAALASALELDDYAGAYLRRLAAGWTAGPPAHRSPDLAGLLTSTEWPTVVLNACQDVVAANASAGRVWPAFFRPGRNVLVELVAMDASARTPGWVAMLDSCVAAVRFHSHPDDARQAELVQQLSGDALFRQAWSRYDVRPNIGGGFTKPMDGYGDVYFEYRCFDARGAEGTTVCTIYAEPGSVAERALFGDRLDARESVSRS